MDSKGSVGGVCNNVEEIVGQVDTLVRQAVGLKAW